MDNAKILFLVDDNSTNLTVGKAILEKHYRMYTFNSGILMFKLIEKVLPDLILLDILMPGMSGYEVLDALKADDRLKDIPVIMLTAHDKPGVLEESIKKGAKDLVSKPFLPNTLLKCIENHLPV